MACDVFVSYAHRDNQVPEGLNTPGFVSRLVSFVTVRGSQRYGLQDLDVFWDDKLASGTLWESTIYEKLATCRVFLPIVSPSWKNSKWAGREWDEVWKREQADQTLGNQTRIVPVSFLLDKGLTASLPPKVKSLQFNRRFRTLMTEREFEEQAEGLAEDIAERLGALDKVETPRKREATKAKIFVGFALSEEFEKSRDRVKQELDNRGYGIRDVQLDLSWTAQQLSAAIEKEMVGCTAAVHFLEKSPGPHFPGDNRPLVQIQCELAMQRKDLFNLFWTGEVTEKELQGYPRFVDGLEYSNDPIAGFAASLLARLEEREPEKSMVRRPQPSTAPMIWVICESGDLEIAPDIVSFFREKGLAAFVPGFNATEIPYSKIFEKEFYFLFYWGKGGKDWCSINYQELVDARRVGMGFRPPLAALIYNGQEKLEYKERFQWLWLKASEYDRFNPSAARVQEFVAQVENTWRALSIGERSTA